MTDTRSKEVEEKGELEKDFIEVEKGDDIHSIRLKLNPSNVIKWDIFNMNVLCGRRKRIMMK